MELQRPSLYTLADDERSLHLLIAVCPECGTTNFPVNVYGCANCGVEPERLRRDSLNGRGVLHNFVTLHQPLVAGLEAPVVVGEVEIAGGVVVEALIDCKDESELHAGMAVQAMAKVEERDGEAKLACHFVPQGVLS